MHSLLLLAACLCPASDTDARAALALASARPSQLWGRNVPKPLAQAPLPPQAPRAVCCDCTGCPCGCGEGKPCTCSVPDASGWRTYRKADGWLYAWRLAPAPLGEGAWSAIRNLSPVTMPAPVRGVYCGSGG